ncbi:MAG: class I SAM-dependent methyltransferase [Candidatus Manganitrophus sp. SA1]|nr:class I SAM-dependent methyltransferase [Candidatus Manganitrophus morganii]
MVLNQVNEKEALSARVVGCFLKQISKEYRYKFLRKIFRKSIIKPWGRYREIDIIEEVLRSLRPKKCLEWGTGFSTLYFSKFLTEETKWVSIEHEKDWSSHIGRLNQNKKIEIHHVAPNRFPWTDPEKDGAYDDLKDYVEFPATLGKFDFILVDGRARAHCLKKAEQLLEENGVVILHDANRRHYHAPFSLFKHQILLTDYRRSGGIWVGSKEADLGNLLDLNKHRMLFRIYNKYGKLLHV